MRHLDLFSGIGGFALAARWMGWETVAFCEREQYARRVLEQHWPGLPIIDDITQWPNKRIGCDIITGGFPCQPFSCAGKQAGNQDDRYLWPAMLAVIERERPTWVVGENVFGIVKMALDQVLSDLEAIGYATRTFIIPACAVDAQHRRDRVWIVANSNSIKRQMLPTESLFGKQDIQGQLGRSSQNQRNRWPFEPQLGRVVDGLQYRTHRNKALGNAIVPQVAYEIFNHLEAFSQSNKDLLLRKPSGRAVEVAAHNLDNP
jgi:DNA (cytosine-5)-methyltransferase 1